MFIKKDMHPLRKAIRLFLLMCLGLSFGFFATIVYLRISYKDKLMDKDMRDHVFTADVLQHRAMAYISDDKGDYDIAIKLLKLGFYSPIYTQGGMKLLQEKADEGYEPAKEMLISINNPQK
ncbi:MAG: hypothetical protein CBB87_04170 [Micavibrio sp. TMED27]|nr:hypothetical protein [Micavibrio sp.]OUT92016.1 MAG: hypothetical protein CBB87_04170 [Micavibrio sp. TMED27]|tara:strand:- start:1969 stop:2331 length:363 start_codon:yes stop_codon:yes gene_type:complete